MPHILICDDDDKFLSYIRLVLENKNYKVTVAKNGKKALKILLEDRNIDLIISDIMMPQMDGYELFKEVMKLPYYTTLPFIFISGLSSEKDIRLGKLLGVDDYITKPINEKNLLAVIKGKLQRKLKEDSVKNNMTQIFQEEKEITIPQSKQNIPEENDIIIFIVKWDDRYGPELVGRYPKTEIHSFNIHQLGNHLFQAMIPIYGQSQISRAENVLLNIDYLNMNTYIYFDAYLDSVKRSKQTQFMISVIAPKINYLHSLKLKTICQEISLKIKQKGEMKPNLKQKWIKINQILMSET
ncbi:MAG: Signal transduction response regulator [Promethearchaeota archaeon]|nr:MAG: Signal transduction response regulator [Candidatus Lokiarchaeota archaeon]